MIHRTGDMTALKREPLKSLSVASRRCCLKHWVHPLRARPDTPALVPMSPLHPCPRAPRTRTPELSAPHSQTPCVKSPRLPTPQPLGSSHSNPMLLHRSPPRGTPATYPCGFLTLTPSCPHPWPLALRQAPISQWFPHPRCPGWSRFSCPLKCRRWIERCVGSGGGVPFKPATAVCLRFMLI